MQVAMGPNLGASTIERNRILVFQDGEWDRNLEPSRIQEQPQPTGQEMVETLIPKP